MRKFIIIVVASLVPVGMWTAGCRQNNKQAAFPKTSEMKGLAKKTDKKNSNLPPEIPPAPIDRDILNLPESATLARVQALDDRTNVLTKTSPDAGLFTLPDEKYRIAQAEPIHEPVSGAITPVQEKREFWSKPTAPRGRSGAHGHADVSAMAPAAYGENYFGDASGGGGESLLFIPAPSEPDAAPQPRTGKKLLPPEDVPGIFFGEDQPLSQRNRGRSSSPDWDTAGLADSDALGASPFLSSAQSHPRRFANRKNVSDSPAGLSARDFNARETASRTRATRKTAARKTPDRDQAAARGTYRRESDAFGADYPLASAASSSRGLPPAPAAVFSDRAATNGGPLRLDLSGLMGSQATDVSEPFMAGDVPAASRSLSGVSTLDSLGYSAPLPAGPLLFPEPGLPGSAAAPVSLAGSADFLGASRPVADSISDNAPASAAGVGAGAGLSGPAPLPMDDGLAQSLVSAEARTANRPASADLKHALAPLPNLSYPAAPRQQREPLQPPPAVAAKRSAAGRDGAAAESAVATAGTQRLVGSGQTPEAKPEAKPETAKAVASVKAPEPEKLSALQQIPELSAVSKAVKPAEKTVNPPTRPLAMPAPVLSPLSSPELVAAKAVLMEPLLGSTGEAAEKPGSLNSHEFFKTDFWENKTASPASLQPPVAKVPEVALADLQLPEMKMPDMPAPAVKLPGAKMPAAVSPVREMPDMAGPETKNLAPKNPLTKASVTPPALPEIPLTPRAPDWVDLPPAGVKDKMVLEKPVEAGKAEVETGVKTENKAEVATEVKTAIKPETPTPVDNETPQRITLKPLRAKRELTQIDAETEVPPLRF